ncbi:MAG: CHAT domain-containing protein, partial [Cyanobacteria bacterium]|nr:CHAT domain-containing protein [Cyanobacteriota bacterium]MDW8200889.1 CHAT domain-containing protein [Cyanobacteriota bacterium SKYGB_h_bin112]
MTQEFQVSVTPVGGDEYLIRTERVAPGVPLAEEQVVWAVEDWLVQARQLMNDPLLTILRGTGGAASAGVLRSQASSSVPLRSGKSTEPPLANTIFDLVSLGQCLYGALFQGTIRDSWVTAQGIAQHRQDLLRLRLGLKGDRLWRLPWEVLHRGDRPITTGTDVVFSRYQFGQGMVRPVMQAPNLGLKPGQPLRILMAIAAPTDQERLDLAREARHLQEELLASSPAIPSSADYGASPTTAIQLTILEQPDREQLTRELEQGHYQVLHYAGHSNLGASGGDLYLVSGRTGLTETLSGDDLAGLLVNNGIRLAVFNSCRSAYTTDNADGASEQNLAEALIRHGVPAVLAMAERIPDEVALTLTRLFYRNLKQGYAIDLSLNRTRQGLLSAYGSNQLYWALPILYLNPDFDGCLVPPVANQRPYPDV